MLCWPGLQLKIHGQSKTEELPQPHSRTQGLSQALSGKLAASVATECLETHVPGQLPVWFSRPRGMRQSRLGVLALGPMGLAQNQL